MGEACSSAITVDKSSVEKPLFSLAPIAAYAPPPLGGAAAYSGIPNMHRERMPALQKNKELVKNIV